MSGSPVVMATVMVPIGLLLFAAGGDTPRASSTEGCDKRRRYRFDIEGKEAWNGNTRFVGVERVLYHPSDREWTRDTNVDLGYLDLCLADGNRCDRPYYPGGKSTPFPRVR